MFPFSCSSSGSIICFHFHFHCFFFPLLRSKLCPQFSSLFPNSLPPSVLFFFLLYKYGRDFLITFSRFFIRLLVSRFLDIILSFYHISRLMQIQFFPRVLCTLSFVRDFVTKLHISWSFSYNSCDLLFVISCKFGMDLYFFLIFLFFLPFVQEFVSKILISEFPNVILAYIIYFYSCASLGNILTFVFSVLLLKYALSRRCCIVGVRVVECGRVH